MADGDRCCALGASYGGSGELDRGQLADGFLPRESSGMSITIAVIQDEELWFPEG